MKNLLIYRWIIVNAAIAGLLVFPFLSGHAQILFEQDSTYLSHGIAILGIVAWLAAAREIFRVSMWRNEYEASINAPRTPRLRTVPAAVRDKALSKIAWLSEVGEWLVGLGLLGTVIGFSISLSGIDQASLASAEGVLTSISQLMRGMRVAINTTIIGAVAALIVAVNVRMLRTAAESYWADRQQ